MRALAREGERDALAQDRPPQLLRALGQQLLANQLDRPRHHAERIRVTQRREAVEVEVEHRRLRLRQQVRRVHREATVHQPLQGRSDQQQVRRAARIDPAISGHAALGARARDHHRVADQPGLHRREDVVHVADIELAPRIVVEREHVGVLRRQHLRRRQIEVTIEGDQQGRAGCLAQRPGPRRERQSVRLEHERVARADWRRQRQVGDAGEPEHHLAHWVIRHTASKTPSLACASRG